MVAVREDGIDLDLVSTDDLVQELRDRTDVGLVALGYKNVKGHEQLRGKYSWWGGQHEALGIAHDIAFRIVGTIKET